MKKLTFGHVAHGVVRFKAFSELEEAQKEAPQPARPGRCEALRWLNGVLLSRHRLKTMGCGASTQERHGTPAIAAVIPTVDLKETPAPRAKPGKEDESQPSKVIDGKIERQDKQDSKEAQPAEWQRPATWPARKEVMPPSPDAPHVVLSTKFVEPWGTISRGFKEILEEKGCTVYNPNTVTWTVNCISVPAFGWLWWLFGWTTPGLVG